MKNKFIILLTLLFLSFSNVDAFSLGTGTGSSESGGWDPESLSSYNLPDQTIYDIISNILSWLLEAFALLGLIGFLIAGILYLVAAGDEKQAEKAKKAMMYSIYGILAGLSGYVVIQAVNNLLNARNF